MPDASLNYIWVGPPKSKVGGELASDVAKVVEMAKQVKNPISFYCLDEHAEEYKELFKSLGIENVTVEPINAYFDSVSKQNPSLRKQVSQMKAMKKRLISPSRNQIIDRVSFKDAFVLFLLASKGGYTLDTNISLDQQKLQGLDGDSLYTFPSYDKIKVPHDSAYYPEVWLMYSPPHSLTAQRMLDYYLAKFDDLQRTYHEGHEEDNEVTSIYQYHKAIVGLMVYEAVYRCVDPEGREFFTPQEYTDAPQDDFWFVEEHEDDFVSTGKDKQENTGIILDPRWRYRMSGMDATFPDLPIIKRYENSHKPWVHAQALIVRNFENLKKIIAGKSHSVEVVSLEHCIGLLIDKVEKKLQKNTVCSQSSQEFINNAIKVIGKLVELEERVYLNPNNFSDHTIIKKMKDAKEEFLHAVKSLCEEEEPFMDMDPKDAAAHASYKTLSNVLNQLQQQQAGTLKGKLRRFKKSGSGESASNDSAPLPSKTQPH